ncbi:putative TMhelix containing protein [Vibrio phage 142E35-1]|nr:putative TMhelix containing protein [Vibrio phage 142E35-1]
MSIKIKRYNEYGEHVDIIVDDLLLFLKANKHEVDRGYRYYEDGVDITFNVEKLMNARNIVMQAPYAAPVIAWVAANWVLVAVAVGSFAYSYYMGRQYDASAADNQNRSQNSATNSFGSRTNEQAINSRIDDIWGTVHRHTPRLMSVPRIDYVDNVEVEKFATYISMGKVEPSNVRDGDTAFERLTNGKFNLWWPGGNPNHATNRTPDFQIGGVIDEPLVITQESRELQATELSPPNDLAIGGTPKWNATSNVNNVVLHITNGNELEVDLREFFTVGDSLSMIETVVVITENTMVLWRSSTPDPVDKEFTIVGQTENISGTFEVIGVTEDTVTIDTTDAFLQTFSEKPLMTKLWQATRSSDNLSFSTEDVDITQQNWFEDEDLIYPIINVTDIAFSPAISSEFDEFVEIENEPFCDKLQFNFVARSGFYKVVKGSDKYIEANIEITLVEIDEDGDPTGSTSTRDVTFTSNDNSLRKQSAISYTRDNPYDRSLSLVRRTTNRDKNENVVNIDEIQFDKLYFLTNIPDQDYGDVTVAQVEIPYSISASGVKDRRLNLDVTRYVTPYIGNGQFGPEAPIDTVAETVVAMSLDKYNGRLTLNDIDADLYLSVQQQLIEYYGNSDFVRIGYDFDSTTLRFQDEYLLLWNAVSCRGYAQNAKYKVYPDILRTDSSKQFTHRNKIPGTDTRSRSYKVQNDGIELTYRSNESGDFETIILHVNGVDSVNRIELELSGAVSEMQASVRAYRELNMLKYQRISVVFEGDGAARLTVPGERVDVVDNTRIVKRPDNVNTYDVYGGYVEEVSEDGYTVTLSEPVYFTDGETHSIRFSDSQGELMETITATVGSNEYEVVLSDLPSKPLYTGYDMEKSTFTFAADMSRLALPMLIVDTESTERDELKTRQLSCINYSELYYQNDQDWSL